LRIIKAMMREKNKELVNEPIPKYEDKRVD
jgi:hypothetical protein